MQIKGASVFIIIVVVGIVCYWAGKQSGFTGNSGAGTELVDGIILSRNDTERILDELVVAGFAGKSSVSYGQAVADGIEKLCESNKRQRLYINDVRREIDSATQNTEIINESITGISDAVDYGWQIVLEDAKALERIARITRDYHEDSGENYTQSE